MCSDLYYRNVRGFEPHSCHFAPFESSFCFGGRSWSVGAKGVAGEERAGITISCYAEPCDCHHLKSCIPQRTLITYLTAHLFAHHTLPPHARPTQQAAARPLPPDACTRPSPPPSRTSDSFHPSPLDTRSQRLQHTPRAALQLAAPPASSRVSSSLAARVRVRVSMLPRRDRR